MANEEQNVQLTNDMLVYLSGASLLMIAKAQDRGDYTTAQRGVQVLERLAAAANKITNCCCIKDSVFGAVNTAHRMTGGDGYEMVDGVSSSIETQDM